MCIKYGQHCYVIFYACITWIHIALLWESNLLMNVFLMPLRPGVMNYSENVNADCSSI